MSASTIVLSSSSTRLPAACRLRTASEKVAIASSTSPAAQAARPEEAARAAADEVVLGAGQVAVRAARVGRCRRRRRGPGPGRRGRSRSSPVRSGAPRCPPTWLPVPGRGRRPRAPRRRRRGRTPARRGHRPSSAAQPARMLQHRAAADDRRRQCPDPASAAGCPVGARRSSGSASSTRWAARAKSSAARACRTASATRSVRGVPVARAPVQLRHQVGLLGEQARVQHVGEQVVVAVPGALGVQGDDEQVVALERLQHRC